LSYESAIKKTKTAGSNNTTLKYPVSSDILFPKICIICGTNTEEKYKKIIHGPNVTTKKYTEEYILNIAVCANCTKGINMKIGIFSKTGKSILIYSLIGLNIGIFLFILTYSIFLTIALIALAVVIPVVKHVAQIKKRVKLNDLLKVRLGNDKESLTFDFLNEFYASYIREINSKKNSSKETEEITE